MTANNPFGPNNDTSTTLHLRMGVVDKLGEISKLFNDSKMSGYKLDPTFYKNLFDILRDNYGLNPEIDLTNNDTLFTYVMKLDNNTLNKLYKYLDDTHQRLQNFPVNESIKMKNKKINKALLSEELKRFKSLTDYNYYDDRTTISENFPFPVVAMEDDRAPEPNIILGMAEAEEDGADLPVDDNVDADVEDITADIEAKTDTPEVPVDDANTEIPVDDVSPELPAEEMPIEEPAPDEDSVELDVTELVKGSEAAKQSADSANSKIDQLMGMVDKLENQLASMSAISDKIEGLEKEIERRNPTPKEKLEMRSLDSYPYSVKLSDFWADKGDRYDTGADSDKPEEYVLTQKDVDDSYSESNIEDSFDSDYEEDNF
jgi:hypothetical protein